jgi:GT2 family glycosyltransferase
MLLIRSALQDLRYEILVVSNSGYAEPLAGQLQDIVVPNRLIATGRNLGFSKAVNAGLRAARGQFVLLLNPDCTLVDGRIDRAVEYLRENPQVAVLGPKIVDEQGEVQESGRTFIRPSHFARRVIGRFLGLHSDRIRMDEGCIPQRSVDWVSGACMLVSRDAIDRVGMMDERYFMYVEDMDWCRSFRCHGYEVVYWPHMTVRHAAHRASSGALSGWKPSRLMWIHFASYVKYVLKAARGAWCGRCRSTSGGSGDEESQ